MLSYICHVFLIELMLTLVVWSTAVGRNTVGVSLPLVPPLSPASKAIQHNARPWTSELSQFLRIWRKDQGYISWCMLHVWPFECCEWSGPGAAGRGPGAGGRSAVQQVSLFLPCMQSTMGSLWFCCHSDLKAPLLLKWCHDNTNTSMCSGLTHHMHVTHTHTRMHANTQTK